MNKRKINAVSISILLICLLALIGSIYALFSLNIFNRGNNITSGEIAVTLNVADNAEMTANVEAITSDEAVLFRHSPESAYFTPGATITKYISASSNTQGFKLNYTLSIQSTGDLLPALTISFEPVGDAPQATQDGANLTAAASNFAAGQTHVYKLTISFNIDAGNEYQAKEAQIDLLFTAEQI